MSGKKQPTKLPFAPFAAISVLYFTNSLSQTILFPFAAVMVQSFNVTDDPALLGYYTGYLASSLFTGCLISSSIWGVISDKIGRKPVLLTGLFFNAACALFFGSSKTFTSAMTARFINGLFNTILATGRSTVAELCDETNQAMGFGLIGTSFGAGLLVGPALGGFLCLPSEKYPSLFPPGSFFDKFPFLLPCIVLFFLSSVGFLSTLIFLPETLGRAKQRNANPSTVSAMAISASEPHETPQHCQIVVSSVPESVSQTSSTNEITEPLLGSKETPKCSSIASRIGELGTGLKRVFSSMSLNESDDERSQFLRVALARDTVVSTTIFCVLNFTSTSFNEVFPLWCITPWEVGGLGFQTNDIGLLQTIAGLSLIPLQTYLYTYLVNVCGVVNAFRIAIVFGFVQIMFPAAKMFGQDTVGMHLYLALFMVFRSFTMCVFTSVFILLSNSVEDPKYLGSVNGLAQTLNMCFRAIAPTAFGSLFAWSASQRGRFINADFWFVGIVLLFGLLLLLTCFLTPHVEHRKFVLESEEGKT